MIKFVAEIRTEEGTLYIDTEANTIEDAKDYFENYLKYWGKVQSVYRNDYIINVSVLDRT